MTGLPQAAIDAAIEALKARSSMTKRSDVKAARWHALVALEAAAPYIAAAERERIRQLALGRDARYIPGCGDPDCPHPGRHMATAPFASLLTEGTTP